MSRIGKLPITVPDKVKVTLSDGAVTVEGPRGKLERTLPREISIKQADGQLVFERPSDDYKHRALHGLVRSLVANMVTGVNEGFTKNLELVGVGYRVAKQGEELVQASRSTCRTRRSSRCPASPSRTWARWPPISAGCARPSRTRARA